MREEHVTICEFCQQDFAPAAAMITTCLECFQTGQAHESVYPVLLRDLRAVLPVGGTARFTFVGEGDFVLEVRGPGLYPIIVATIAVQAEGGTWTTHPAVPDPGQPWAVALFRNRDQWPQWPETTKLPATDEDLVAFVAALHDDLDLFSPKKTCLVCGHPRPCDCRTAKSEA